MLIAEDRNAHALAAEHEPEDTEFPVLEAIDVGVRAVIEIEERAGGDEVFATALAGGEEERDMGELLGQDIDGAIDPDDLFVGVGECRTAWAGVFADEPGGDLG